MSIGERIRFYRTQRGLTQQRFAEKLFVSSQAVSKWENGHSIPDILTIARIAGVLGVSCDNLILGADGSLL